MALYHKYRPNTLDSMLGNEQTIEVLRADLAKEDKPHAYLLYGPTGCGKTTLGRIIASELGCIGNDFKELDSADFRGIDTVREMRTQAQFRPIEGECRVWLLDECHKMTNEAQNALLKALEGASETVYYILATTEPQKLLPTIRGRCAQYPVAPLTEHQMYRLLRHIVRSETEELDKAVYDQIILDSLGLPRNALQILDQVLSVPNDRRLEIARHAAETQSQTIELCRALINKSGWKKVSSILTGLKDEDPEQIRRAVLGYCSAILLKSSNDWAAVIMNEFIEPTYNTGFPGITWACYKVANL